MSEERADLIPDTGTDRAAGRIASRIAATAALFLFALALLCAGARAPDEPAVAGRPSLSAIRDAFIAVVPDRVVVAMRPATSAGNRQWLAAASRDSGGGLSGQAPSAVVAADAAIAWARAVRAVHARQVLPPRPSASPFEARAPPAGD
jgi:hypothetical protein